MLDADKAHMYFNWRCLRFLPQLCSHLCRVARSWFAASPVVGERFNLIPACWLLNIADAVHTSLETIATT